MNQAHRHPRITASKSQVFLHAPWYRGLLLITVISVLIGVCIQFGESGSLPEPELLFDEPNAEAMHAALFDADQYPSASKCGKCHPTHYREWSVSQHAYAQLSPIFNTMHAKLVKETNGTLGDFCIRCHTPVGMDMGEAAVMPNAERHPVSREGVTCIVCHRVSEAYGKVSGRRGLDQGPMTMPVKGPSGAQEQIDQVVLRGDATPDAAGSGRKIHAEADRFFQLTESGFCGACHDVNSPRGFRLEEAFSHFKASPAAKKGIRCQDCHMGKEPGIFTGDPKTNFDWGPAARVASVWTKPRKLTNHMIVGPDYSVVHPGIFPHGMKNIREEGQSRAYGLATFEAWLSFDWKAGWGTEAFEKNVDPEMDFPEAWASADERKAARAVIDENLELLEVSRKARLTLLRNGYKLGDIDLRKNDAKKLMFEVDVTNGTTGHPVPTGFDAERLVWLHVQVVDAEGAAVFASGDLDPNGDVRDLHSAYVHDRKLPLDRQLFSLQSRFLTKNLRGSEREEILPINKSFSPLPFVRPPARPIILSGQPDDVRKHRKVIPPGASRTARYTIPRKELDAPYPWTIQVELKAAMVPVNLVHAIQDVGFDYAMSLEDVVQRLVEGHEVLWRREHTVAAPGS